MVSPRQTTLAIVASGQIGVSSPGRFHPANEIAKCNDLTDKPFAVKLTLLPILAAPDFPGDIKAVIEGGVKLVETAGRNRFRSCRI